MPGTPCCAMMSSFWKTAIWTQSLSTDLGFPGVGPHSLIFSAEWNAGNLAWVWWLIPWVRGETTKIPVHKFITLLAGLQAAWGISRCFYTHKGLRKYIFENNGILLKMNLSQWPSLSSFFPAVTSPCLRDSIRSTSNIESKRKELIKTTFLSTNTYLQIICRSGVQAFVLWCRAYWISILFLKVSTHESLEKVPVFLSLQHFDWWCADINGRHCTEFLKKSHCLGRVWRVFSMI